MTWSVLRGPSDWSGDDYETLTHNIKTVTKVSSHTHTHKKKVSRYPQLQTLPHSSRDSINTAPADHPCSHHTVDQDLTKKDQQKKLRTNWQYNKVKKKVS